MTQMDLKNEANIQVIIKIRRIAHGYAIKRGRHYISEDFATFAIIDFIERKYEREMYMVWADYMRIEYGRLDEEYGRLKSEAIRTAVDIDQALDIEQPNNESEERHSAFLNRIIEETPINKRTREMFDMYLTDNFSFKQIGDHYGITESRVSQLINRAIPIIKKKNEKFIKEYINS